MNQTTENKIECNLPNNKISFYEWNIIRLRMYPEQYSAEGFIKQNTYPLKIIQTDEQYLKSVNITHQQISDKLQTIISKYGKIIQNTRFDEKFNLDNLDAFKPKEILVENEYLVSSLCTMGAQECPFQNKKLDDKYNGHQYGSNDFTINHKTTGKKLFFGDLLIHMVAKHHFFEGPGMKYRLEPKEVIDFFRLKPNENYTPIYDTKLIWKSIGSNNKSISDKDMKILKYYALETIIDDKIIGFLFPSDECIVDCISVLDPQLKKGYENNWDWNHIRKLTFQNENEKRKSGDYMFTMKPIDIENRLIQEQQLSNDYIKNKSLKRLYLHLFCKESNFGCIEFTILNVSCQVYNTYTIFKMATIKSIRMD